MNPSPSSYPIRPCTPADDAALVALWERCGLTRPWNNPWRDIARKRGFQPEGLAVMTEGPGGALIGSVMAGYEGHRGWINYLAVDPRCQRSGAGRALMDWAEAWLRARGCPKINLQVRSSNTAVLAFYQALGYGNDEVLSLGKRLVVDDEGSSQGIAPAQAPSSTAVPMFQSAGSGAGALLRVQSLAKRYSGQSVFQGVTLSLEPGEFVALTGESGVGKSTLLNCIAGLDEADAGEIWLEGRSVRSLSEPERARLRCERLGFVFQAFHVLPHLSVAQNVALPLMLLGRPDAQRVAEVLDAVGLAGLQARMPAQLSGGQLQRVALARALVHRPPLILADEPTGNLDPDTAQRMMAVLREQVSRQGAACLLVTHSQAAAAQADSRWVLSATGVSQSAHPLGKPAPRA